MQSINHLLTAGVSPPLLGYLVPKDRSQRKLYERPLSQDAYITDNLTPSESLRLVKDSWVFWRLSDAPQVAGCETEGS